MFILFWAVHTVLEAAWLIQNEFDSLFRDWYHASFVSYITESYSYAKW